jgi:aryl-alcohol dehydrogenase-like predicted oxidoreductase
MRYRTFPDTELSLSEVGFGMWTVSTSWWGVTDDRLRRRLIERGCRPGHQPHQHRPDLRRRATARRSLAEVLGDKRDRVVDRQQVRLRPVRRRRAARAIASGEQDYTPAGIRAQCEASLARLKHRPHRLSTKRTTRGSNQID